MKSVQCEKITITMTNEEAIEIVSQLSLILLEHPKCAPSLVIEDEKFWVVPF